MSDTIFSPKNMPASTWWWRFWFEICFSSLSFVESSILGLEKWRKNTNKNWHRSQICPKYFHMTQEFPNNGHVMGIRYNSFIRFALALSAFSLRWIFTCLPMELQRNRKTKTKNIEFWAHLFISGVSTFLLVFFLFLSFSFNFCIYTSRQFSLRDCELIHCVLKVNMNSNRKAQLTHGHQILLFFIIIRKSGFLLHLAFYILR